jgi:hypothetical protein
VSQQYDRQLSLKVSDPINPLASTQATTESSSGTTTTFGEAGATQNASSTSIEFGLLTPGATAVKSATRPTAGFKITFTVRRGDIQTPNSADVRIYNLNDDTANQIGTREFRRLTISAGYPGNFGLIFAGDVKQVRIGRENAVDSYVDITAADGDSVYNYSNMALTLAAGAKPADAVQAFLQSFASGAIIRGYTPDLSTSGSVRNRVFYGMTRDELRDFAEAHDLTWFIDDGKLTFVPKTGYIPGTPVILSPQNGLLGVPEQTQNGIEATILLNSQIKIGQLVKLQNTTINQLRYGLDRSSQAINPQLLNTVKLNAQGLYYVMSAEHIGDTRGQSWESRLVLLSVDAQVPESAVTRAAIFPSSAVQRN